MVHGVGRCMFNRSAERSVRWRETIYCTLSSMSTGDSGECIVVTSLIRYEAATAHDHSIEVYKVFTLADHFTEVLHTCYNG